MPKIQSYPVGDLKLDLHNYRTVPQPTEEKSVHALISIDPVYFWALTESLLDDGWLGTENVLVLQDGAQKIVKEGNRRVGAIKLILGNFKLQNFTIPEDVKARIEAATAQWKKDNAEIPCNVFSKAEVDQVEKLVGLTHAKGEKAGRLPWNAVARARFNRDEAGHSEPGLDLLEKYLKLGKNIDATQKELWGGEYPLSILDEALKKLAPRVGTADSRAASDEYPKSTKFVSEYEKMLHDIGIHGLKFTEIRDTGNDFLVKYGFPAPPPLLAPPAGATPSAGIGTGGPVAGTSGSAAGSAAPGKATRGKAKTLSLSEPKSVKKELRKFAPRGKTASKIVDLLEEAKKLSHDETPIAFCFVLRSMFEVSVRDYCSAHRISSKKVNSKGNHEDKTLAELLTEAGAHLTAGSTDSGFVGRVRTAVAEIKNKRGILSIPVINGLVHSPTATIPVPNITSGFHHVFPLLVSLNK